MSSNLSSRRTACNRCRSHKLRCIRATENNHSGICQRCLRAGVNCVTSATTSSGGALAALHRRSRRLSLRSERTEEVGLPQQEHNDQGSETQVLTPVSTVAESQTDMQYNLCDSSDLQRTSGVPDAQSMQSLKATTAIQQNVLPRHPDNPSTDHSSLDILDPSLIQSLPPPLDAREACVRKLAGLHSSLVLDLNTVRSCQTADKCTTIINMPEFSQTYNFPIGRMLSASAKLIEILHYFVAESLPPETPTQQAIHCDTPTLLSILTCYTYLTRIYRIILTSIHKSIVNKEKTLPCKLPPLFPGLHLGGYSLEPHLDVQVKLLVQTCEMMLVKIDDALGLSSEGRTGLLGRVEGSVELLQGMVEREMGEDCVEEVLVGDGRVSLVRIIEGLKAVCVG